MATKQEVHEQFAEFMYSFDKTEDGIAEGVAAMAVDNFVKYAKRYADAETHLNFLPTAKKLSALLLDTYKIDIHPSKLEMFLEREFDETEPR